MHLKSHFPEIPAPPDQNAYHWLFERPDQEAWPTDFTLHIDARTGKRRSYRTFVERVRLGSTALGAPVSQGGLGIRGEDGECIGIIGQNSSDYVTLVNSLLLITTPFALISTYSKSFELRHALELARPTRLFVHARFLPTVLPVAEKLGLPLKRIYLLGGRSRGMKTFSEMIEEARSRKIPLLSPRPAKRDTLAYVVFSSGTSGLPKAVMISHGNIIFSLMQGMLAEEVMAKVYPPQRLDTPEGIPIVLCVLPLYHSYGLHVSSIRAFVRPATFVILDQWNLKTALKALSKYTITFAPLIPSLVHQIANYASKEKINFSSLRAVSCGAAYLPPELKAKFSALMPKDIVFTEGYGMSETTIAALSQPLPGTLDGKGKLVPGSTGILLPGMEARLVRDDGTEAGVNEVGELHLRGHNVAMGYWNDEKATKETFVNGWLRTGDKFRANEEGYFFFAHRAKDTLKVSGLQVSPTEIENILLAEPRGLIIDVCVGGVSGGRTSDEKVPHAWIVLSDVGRKLGPVATIRELEKWHQENLSKFKWLRGGIEVVQKIPKSPTGKVLRRVLQERHEEKFSKGARSKL